jgi:parallel beta-helix repeat protein
MTSKQTTRLGKAPEEGIKAPVVVSSVANLPLSGLPIISAVQLVEGDRVLVKNQTDATQNGIYCAFLGTWDRASDWNKANDVVNGVLVLDSNTGQLYRASFSGDFSINVTVVNFFIVQSFNSKDETLLSDALLDDTYQVDDVVHIKSIDGGANETTMIFDVVTSVTEDIPNGIYSGVSHSFAMRDRDDLVSSTLTEAKARKDYKVGSVISWGERTTGSGGSATVDIIAGTGSANGANIVAHDTLSLSLSLRFENDTDGKAFGLVGDGSTGDKATLAIIDALGGCKFTDGTYFIESNIALIGDYFWAGGLLKGGNLVGITIVNQIDADYQIFDTSAGCEFFTGLSHNFTEVKSVWFGHVKGAGASLSVGSANMLSIAEATTMAGRGVSDGFSNSPTMRMPIGRIGINGNSGVGAIVKSYQTVKGINDSTFLEVAVGAETFDVFKVIEPGANSVIFDHFEIAGNQASQTNTQNGIVIAPTSSPCIYSKIGTGIYIKEMSGHGIRVEGAGMDNSNVAPFLVRDNKLGNLFVNACNQLNVAGSYRSSKGASNSILFDSTGVESATLNGVISEENGGAGLFVSNIGTETGVISVVGGSFSRNGGSGITFDRAFYSSAVGAKCERNSEEGVVLLNTIRTSVKSCTVEGNKKQGIKLTGSDKCSVIDNDVDNNSDTNTNVFDGIVLFTSDDNNIQGNNVKNSLSTQRYGIAIDAASSATNFVTNNDLKNSGNTGAFLDNGTGTSTTAGNRLS